MLAPLMAAATLMGCPVESLPDCTDGQLAKTMSGDWVCAEDRQGIDQEADPTVNDLGQAMLSCTDGQYPVRGNSGWACADDLATSVSTLQTDVVTAQDGVNTVGMAVTEEQAARVALEARVAQVEVNTGGPNPDLANVIAEVQTGRGNFNSLGIRLDDLDSRISGVGGRVTSIEAELVSARAGMQTVGARLDPIDTLLTDVANEVVQGRGPHLNLNTRLTSVETRLSDLETPVVAIYRAQIDRSYPAGPMFRIQLDDLVEDSHGGASNQGGYFAFTVPPGKGGLYEIKHRISFVDPNSGSPQTNLQATIFVGARVNTCGGRRLSFANRSVYQSGAFVARGSGMARLAEGEVVVICGSITQVNPLTVVGSGGNDWETFVSLHRISN